MRALALALIPLLAGCSDFPDLGGAVSPAAATAPAPRLVPIEGLILAAIGPSRPGEPLDAAAALAATTGSMAARVAALKARAAILRGAPVDETTRSKLDGT